MAISITTKIIEKNISNNLFNNILNESNLKSYRRSLRFVVYKLNLALFIKFSKSFLFIENSTNSKDLRSWLLAYL